MPRFVLFWNLFLNAAFELGTWTAEQNIPKDFNLFRRDNLNIILITVVFFYLSFRFIFSLHQM